MASDDESFKYKDHMFKAQNDAIVSNEQKIQDLRAKEKVEYLLEMHGLF